MAWLSMASWKLVFLLQFIIASLSRNDCIKTQRSIDRSKITHRQVIETFHSSNFLLIATTLITFLIFQYTCKYFLLLRNNHDDHNCFPFKSLSANITAIGTSFDKYHFLTLKGVGLLFKIDTLKKITVFFQRKMSLI